MAPSHKTGPRAVRAAAPTVQHTVDYLREQDKTGDADAVGTVLEYALISAWRAFGGPAFPLYLDTDLADRAKSHSSAQDRDITATVLEGFYRFLAGTWLPPEPQRAARNSNPDKSVTSVRLPKDVVAEVDARAAEYAHEQGWSMARGYKLTARRIAVSYLEHEFPPLEYEQAAE